MTTFKLPGLKSYRYRYLYSTAFALLIINFYTYDRWKEITESSQVTQQNIIFRSNYINTLNNIINQFLTIKAKIYQYSWTLKIIVK